MQTSPPRYRRGVKGARCASAEHRRYWHAFAAQQDGIVCTLIAGDSPDPAPAPGPFLAPFPFSGDPAELEWTHIGTWDHEPTEAELTAARKWHRLGEDLPDPPEAA